MPASFRKSYDRLGWGGAQVLYYCLPPKKPVCLVCWLPLFFRLSRCYCKLVVSSKMDPAVHSKDIFPMQDGACHNVNDDATWVMDG